MLKKILKTTSILLSLMWVFTIQAQDHITLTVDLEKTYQEVDNFAASDCWSLQYIGKNWELDKKEKIAQWLFSQELDSDGQPLGIGLSAWRYSIGAGSSEQGADSDIKDPWRRGECFVDADGVYDWNKQLGQTWFLKKAKDYGIQQFLAFANSAPVSITIDGKAHGSGKSQLNISADKYAEYADFLCQVVAHFKEEEGVDFHYLAPVNEPQWDWGNKITQEGSACTNTEYAALIKVVDSCLQAKELDTKLKLTECAQIDFAYDANTRLPKRDNQIADFFSASSTNYVGDVATVDHVFAAHSYFTTWPVDEMIEKRQKLQEKLVAYPQLDYWMSEYCILENNEEVKGGGRDFGMNTALYVARVMHHDLTICNAAAWQWWLAVSPYNYKDGLIYVDKDTLNGDVYDSKLLWSMGNYSRFVRPGMQRVEISQSHTPSLHQQAGQLMVSAFVKEEEKVIVAINYSDDDQAICIDGKREKYIPYITSEKEGDDLKPLSLFKSNTPFVIPARSVVTFVKQ